MLATQTPSIGKGDYWGGPIKTTRFKHILQCALAGCEYCTVIEAVVTACFPAIQPSRVPNITIYRSTGTGVSIELGSCGSMIDILHMRGSSFVHFHQDVIGSD